MIHYFNPGHETAVLNASPYYMAPANVAVMQSDLAYLPAWYAHSGDSVLVVNEAVKDYQRYLSNQLNNLPNAILKNDLKYYKNVEVAFWGISPQAIHIFREINNEYNLDLRLPPWKEEYLYLNSRQASRNCLEELQAVIPEVSQDIIPSVCTTLDEIECAVNESCTPLLAKAPYSSSGRGLLWLPVDGLTQTERQILHGILKKQGAVMIEAVLDKRMDFAMEFMSDGTGNIIFEGYSLFETNNKGAYNGNYLYCQTDIENQLKKMIEPELLDRVKMHLTQVLSTKYAPYYKGCIGVDMMLYNDSNQIKIHPCVEINMRYNMGYLSLCFSQNYLSEKSHGRYYLGFNSKAGAMLKSHMEMIEKYPAQFDNGKISSGYLSLCPVDGNTHYRAYVLIQQQ